MRADLETILKMSIVCGGFIAFIVWGRLDILLICAALVVFVLMIYDG